MMMTNNIGWKRLRILVTNKCNYRCPFCHNEGQSKEERFYKLSFDDFKYFIDSIADQPLEELHFSGGEPFMNERIVDMINYVCRNTNWDIGCASNLSLISDEHIEQLSGCRVKFNIQYPYADSVKFRESTGNGIMQIINSNIEKLRKASIKVGLNTVVQNHNMDYIEELVQYAINNELPLKLLPQLGGDGVDRYKGEVFSVLSKYSVEKRDKGTGAVRLVVTDGLKRTTVLYIDSPCFYNDFDCCKRFGELRILPDFTLQPCISKSSDVRLNLKEGNVVVQLNELWKNFKSC